MRRLALAFVLAMSPPLAHAAEPAGGATQAVRASNQRLRAALTRYVKSRGPAREKARSEARAAVSALLDFDALAKATMGKRWEELKPAQRKLYTEALRGAMEANYLARMQKGSIDVENVKDEIIGEERQGERTIVKTKVISGQDTVELDYVLQRRSAGWRAVDIITEGTSLAETYEDQINRLMPKKGFDGVVQALERKRKQLEQEIGSAPEKTAADRR